MKGLLPKNNQQKHWFKSYHCAGCLQSKPCQLLTGWDSEWKSYCCACYYEGERYKAAEYSSLEKVLRSKRKEKRSRFRQLQLFKSYSGCPECGSLEVDAYSWYENSRLVCQTCFMKKVGWTSSPISFSEEQKWFKKWWKIDLGEWLTKYQCLPVNASCARKWLKKQGSQQSKNHLNNCQCLEQEAKESYLLVNDNLKSYQTQLKECQCEVSPKVRVSSDDYTWCEKCKVSISVASKKRVIKNRNDPRFWGIESEWKILCLKCLGERFYEKMEERQRKKWREYVRRGYILLRKKLMSAFYTLKISYIPLP